MSKSKPLSDQLRDAIERCGLTRYRIGKETGIAASILSRFVHGGAGLSLANIDKICALIGARLVLDGPAKEKATTATRKRKGN